MRVHTDFENFGLIKNAVVTTGTFDGVHAGHKTLLNRLKQLASMINGESVLITFQSNPAKVLYPNKSDKAALITTKNEKIALLRETGIDHLFIIPFTHEFAKTTSHSFVKDILKDKIHARIVIVGINHHFGHNRTGNFNSLHQFSKNYGFMVEEIPMQDIENEIISSTCIRKAIEEGNIEQANLYLDHFYLLLAKTKKTGQCLYYKSSKVWELCIEEKEKLLPSDGAYKVCIPDNNKTGIILINTKTESLRMYFIPEDKTLDLQVDEVYSFVFHTKIRNRNSDRFNLLNSIHETNQCI